MQFWKLAANLLRISATFWVLIGVIAFFASPTEPFWAYIIAWGIVFVLPGFLTWLLSNWCVKKASISRKQRFGEIRVSREKEEETIQPLASETDESYPVEEATIMQEENVVGIGEEQEVQISPKTERFPQKQRAEAVSIIDSLAGCKHENVILIPVFQVKGEPRRVIKKCLDCGKVLKKDRISR